MAAVKSSLMKTINSFIHERGHTAGGRLFIVVCWMCVEAAGKPPKDQLHSKSSNLQTLLPMMKLILQVPRCKIWDVLAIYLHIATLNAPTGTLCCLWGGGVWGEIFKVLSKPQHKLHLCFVDCCVELECHHTSFALESMQGGRPRSHWVAPSIPACSERSSHPANRKEVGREIPPNLLILKWTPYSRGLVSDLCNDCVVSKNTSRDHLNIFYCRV